MVDSVGAPLQRLSHQPAARPAERATPAAIANGPRELASAIGNRAFTALLQRAPAARATANVTRAGGRLTQARLDQVRETREVADDADEAVNGIGIGHLAGEPASDITGRGRNAVVRIDIQNPTPTHQNLQIQTNGRSVSIATVLIPLAMIVAPPRGLVNAVRAAFRGSLGDGMQWEVFDDAEVPAEKPASGKGGGKGREGREGRERRGKAGKAGKAGRAAATAVAGSRSPPTERQSAPRSCAVLHRPFQAATWRARPLGPCPRTPDAGGFCGSGGSARGAGRGKSSSCPHLS